MDSKSKREPYRTLASREVELVEDPSYDKAMGGRRGERFREMRRAMSRINAKEMQAERKAKKEAWRKQREELSRDDDPLGWT